MKANTPGKVALGQATRKDLGPCVDVLMDSVLGGEYFSRDLAREMLAKGIANKEVTVARSDTGEILGFCRLVMDGVFLVFAYIHLIVVKTGHRGMGIGSLLLDHAEGRIRDEEDYPDIKKSFLLVGKLNTMAKHYYERRGYTRVGTLHDLFSAGDTEFLMVKELGQRS